MLDRSLKVVAPGDFDGDGDADLISRRADGELWFYAGDGDGGYTAPRAIGSGWSVYDAVIGVGDYNEDGTNDLVARRPDGSLWFYAGTGIVSSSNEGYRSATRIGNSGWSQFSQLVGGHDLNGDGRTDLLAKRPDGTVYVYAGTGTGAHGKSTLAGTGWGGFNHLVASGDFSGDGKADVLARKSDGTLWRMAGTGRSKFTSAEKIGNSGWNQFSQILGLGDNNRDGHADLLGVRPDQSLVFYAGTGMQDRDGYKPGTRINSFVWDGYDLVITPGDFNGDHLADTLARKPDGTLWIMAGNGRAGHGAPRQIGAGWDIYNDIIGVGDYNGNGKNDLIARHKDGSLWFYPGTGRITSTDEGYLQRQKIGNSGWNQLDTLLGIGDFDSNGNNDLLARDMNGALWLYSGPGTGKSHGPRTKIGSGWQTYDQLVAPGDFNGDDKNDIIATDAEGVLWFYSGTGQITNSDEGYLQRQKIGTSGWTMFSDVLGIGDYNSDNKTDLLGIDHNGNAWFYQGTQMQDPGYQPMTPGGTL